MFKSTSRAVFAILLAVSLLNSVAAMFATHF